MNARGHVRDRFLNYPSGSLHTFSVLAGALTHIRVSMWWGGFCYLFTALDSTGGICISRLFIKSFYYTFVDIFRNLHMFKNVNWFFKSNRLAVKNQGFVLKMSFAILFFYFLCPWNPCTYDWLLGLLGITLSKISFNSVTPFFPTVLTHGTNPSTR